MNTHRVMVVFPDGGRFNLLCNQESYDAWKEAALYLALPLSSWIRYLLVEAAREIIGREYEASVALLHEAAEKKEPGGHTSAWARSYLDRAVTRTLARAAAAK